MPRLLKAAPTPIIPLPPICCICVCGLEKGLAFIIDLEGGGGCIIAGGGGEGAENGSSCVCGDVAVAVGAEKGSAG